MLPVRIPLHRQSHSHEGNPPQRYQRILLEVRYSIPEVGLHDIEVKLCQVLRLEELLPGEQALLLRQTQEESL